MQNYFLKPAATSLKRFCAVVLLVSSLCAPAGAQTLEVLGGDVLNGAVNGLALGGATMAMQNTTSYEALRVGLGGGILFGLGVGIYDITRMGRDDYFYKSGIFNDGTNSTILVLLDTVYGTAAGCVLASSVALLAQKDLLESLRYGAGIGAWTGFGFGLVDTFVLAEGPGDFTASAGGGERTASGLLQYRGDGSWSLGLLSPGLVRTVSPDAVGPRTELQPALGLLNLNVNL
ncbi:MAG: hypothetical protein U5K31_01905 [Balneolaceae bacterium]|nr:hypothetical protein [Balneolaceae bacterium]